MDHRGSCEWWFAEAVSRDTLADSRHNVQFLSDPLLQQLPWRGLSTFDLWLQLLPAVFNVVSDPEGGQLVQPQEHPLVDWKRSHFHRRSRPSRRRAVLVNRLDPARVQDGRGHLALLLCESGLISRRLLQPYIIVHYFITSQLCMVTSHCTSRLLSMLRLDSASWLLITRDVCLLNFERRGR
jgi:hypothetical protein